MLNWTIWKANEREYDLFFRPVGVFEFAKFEAGTKAVMDAVVEATSKGATTIIGMYKIH